MPDLTRPEPEATPPGQLGIVETPPAAVGDPFTVTVPGFSESHFYEIERWQSRGATIPDVGDEVLVVVDDKGEPWVAAWWPAAGDVPPGEGPEGPAGPAGPAGPEGPAGPKGVVGAAGPEGPAGAKGAEGAKGVEGKEGPQGKEGKEGPQGVKGAEGAKGATGAAGSTWFEGEGVPAEGLGVDGDFYLRTSNGAFFHKEGGKWVLAGNLTGPKGDPGPGAPFATWSELVEEYATWGSLI